MRDYDGGEVVRANPEPGQGVTNQRRRRRGARFHQARTVAPDQVTGRDPVVPGHPGVDLEHLMPERRDARRSDSICHAAIVPQSGRRRTLTGGAAAAPRVSRDGPNVRRTRPVRGLGPNDVDLRGTRSPLAPRSG